MMMAMVHKRWFSLHGDDGGFGLKRVKMIKLPASLVI
jgi:hypothetical protein